MKTDISNLTVAQLKDMVYGELEKNSVDETLLDLLSKDSRVGAQQLYKLIHNKRIKIQNEHCRLQQMYTYENKLIDLGIKYIAGVDEAGRGPLAGPVVAGAVILPPGVIISGLNDSKKLSACRREELYEEIREKSVAWAFGIATVKEINRLNILNASLLAMKRSVLKLSIQPDHLLVDGLKITANPIPQTPIVGGDGISATIAAASIIAKTTRDKIMEKYHQKYSNYGFDKHKGYPTSEHLHSLRKYGPCAIHRTGFAPVIEASSPKLFL